MIKIKHCAKANAQTFTIILEPGDKLYDNEPSLRPMRAVEFTDEYLKRLGQRRLDLIAETKANHARDELIFEDDHTLVYTNDQNGEFIENIGYPCTLDIEKIREAVHDHFN